MFFPADLMPDGPKLDTKKALILLDFQNDFVSPKGSLHVPNTLSILPRLPHLVARFREKNEVAWVKTEFCQPRGTLSTDTGGYAIVLDQYLDQLRASHEERDEESAGHHATDINVPDCYEEENNHQPQYEPDAEAFLAAQLPATSHRCCTRGSWGAQHPTKLADCIDQRRDIQVVKSDYSALVDMNFTLQLRTRLVTDLYMCGTLSNISVYATVVDAVRQGFNVTLIEDCLGFRNEACHIESVRQMADLLGADGTDVQELMDDLAGMLGDVVHESDFHSSFQVSMQPRSKSKSGMERSQKVNDWMHSMEKQVGDSYGIEEDVRIASNWQEHDSYLKSRAEDKDESSHTIKNERNSSNSSPPRKRPSSARDEPDEREHSTSSHHLHTRRASHDTYERSSRTNAKKIRPGRPLDTSIHTAPKLSTSTHPQTLTALGQSRSTGDLPDPSLIENSQAALSHDTPEGNKNKKMKKQPLTFLGPEDCIGDGDSSIVHDVLGREAADRAFYALKANVQWQKMYHRSGEVPRLVAVQGDTFGSGSIIPIYRHPADESPELLPFDETVNELRQACEKIVKHPLNHVLIQYYRTSEDNISEHSDKTLDIVRGSSIVNLSLGAMRTMMLRTKKAALNNSDSANTTNLPDTSQSSARLSQRIHLPHDSIFILGQKTNANYLHSIRADKRPPIEKSPEELAFNSERISLTFRHIGTFIDTKSKLIWGQGARGKTQNDARAIPEAGSASADLEGEEMIIAFGRENHLNSAESTPAGNGANTDAIAASDGQGAVFDWDREYGRGFDVVNFVVRAAGQV